MLDEDCRPIFSSDISKDPEGTLKTPRLTDTVVKKFPPSAQVPQLSAILLLQKLQQQLPLLLILPGLPKLLSTLLA